LAPVTLLTTDKEAAKTAKVILHHRPVSEPAEDHIASHLCLAALAAVGLISDELMLACPAPAAAGLLLLLYCGDVSDRLPVLRRTLDDDDFCRPAPVLAAAVSLAERWCAALLVSRVSLSWRTNTPC